VGGGKVKVASRRAPSRVARAAQSGLVSAGIDSSAAKTVMPTLIRLIVILVMLAVLGGAAMLALAYLVEPTQREISVDIPAERLQP
jgi:hypothetical protein